MVSDVTLIAVEECRDCAGSGCSWCADTGRVRESKPTRDQLVSALLAEGGEKVVVPEPVLATTSTPKGWLMHRTKPGTYLVFGPIEGGR